MDVLFGSIDVRELLATQNLEESSPVSAPDLRLLIDRLQVRYVEIKQKVQQYILSHHEDFSQVFSRCSLTVSKTEELYKDVNSLLRLIADRPLDVEIRKTVEKICKTKSELAEKKEALVLVRMISILVDRLDLVRKNLKNGLLAEAAENLKELKKILLVSDCEVKETEPRVFVLLRSEWTECFEEVQAFLYGALERSVRFDVENNRLSVTYLLSTGEIEGIELHSVLMALDILDILDYGFGKITDALIKYIVTPTITNKSEIAFSEDIKDDNGQKTEASLSIVCPPMSSCLQGDNRDISIVYSRLVQFIRFTYEFICFHNSKWMRCLGRLMWPRTSDMLITNYLSKVVPVNVAKSGEFKNIIKLSSDFEATLKEMSFISSTDSKDEKLCTFTENVELRLAFKKKNEMLAKARNLILQCEFAPPLAQGRTESCFENVTDLLFHSERCLVSKLVLELMELVHQTLMDVCSSSTRVAKELYHATRDVLLMYEAIVPVKLGKQLDTVNEVAIMMHNDSFYLAQEILGLAFQYRPHFPNGLKEHAVFVDVAPRFLQMAEDTLQKQIHLVSFKLNEVIDGADGFQNTHGTKQFETAKFAIDQVVFILEEVRIMWESLLRPSTYKRAMSTVLDGLFSRIVTDILLLDDMAAEETLQLQRLIHMTVEGISSTFKSLSIDVNESSGNHLMESIPSLSKLHKLADALDMSLKSIASTWESGELARCGFTSIEVQNFIKAIFADSPLRKECLLRIGSEKLEE